MSVRNDSRRAAKSAKHAVEPPPERVVLSWLTAVDLEFAKHAPDLDPPFSEIIHPGVKRVHDGVEVSYEALRLAVNAAPRHVRRRVLGMKVRRA